MMADQGQPHHWLPYLNVQCRIAVVRYRIPAVRLNGLHIDEATDAPSTLGPGRLSHLASENLPARVAGCPITLCIVS